jgi:nucleoside-diphosphate-sugar epimerase
VPTRIALAAAGAQNALARLRGTVNEVTPAGVRYLALRRGTYSIARARELLDWTPAVGVEEGMDRTEGWLREQGLLSA